MFIYACFFNETVLYVCQMLKATEASATRAVLQRKGVLKTPTQVLSCEIGKKF